MNLRLDKKELLNKITSTLSFDSIDGCGSMENINKLITLFNDKYKKDINIKVYFEKLKNGNPYYVNNDQLNKCSQLIPKLASLKLRASNSHQAKKIIDQLYKNIINHSHKVDHDKKVLEMEKVFSHFKLDSLFNNFINNNIFILNFRGGNRNTLPYECELDLSLKIYKDENEEELIGIIKDLVKEYGAQIRI